MFKYLAVLSVLFVLTMAQRSPYAGSPDRSYPQVLPQYIPNNVESTPTVGQRIGESVASVDDLAPLSYEPYNPYEDQQTLDDIAKLPKEKQPFWYLNREAIKAAHQSKFERTTSTEAPTTTAVPKPTRTVRTTLRRPTPPRLAV